MILIAIVAGAVLATATPMTGANASVGFGEQAQRRAIVPAFSHVFVVVLENKELDRVRNGGSASYLNGLSAEYGLATEYYGVTHPSLPNYLATLGGDTFGVTVNCLDCYQSAPSLPDQLEAQGRTWKAYFESMPSPS